MGWKDDAVVAPAASPSGGAAWEKDEVVTPSQQRRATDKSAPLPANAGLASFGASMLGLPVDTVTNVLNLGIAGAGVATGTTPELIQAPVGSSEWLKQKLRGTGAAGLSPDNPTPDSKMGTAQYDFVARGGVIPGGGLPAAGSMIAEKIGGPAWAGVGALAPAAAGRAVAALPSMTPNTPQAQMLAKEGVPLTPGQIKGGAVKRMEDAATSIPVLGDAIKAAQRRGVEAFDAVAVNRALEPIGEKLPKGMTGSKAVEYAYGKLGDAYDNLLPNLKGDLNAGGAASLRTDLDTIKQMGQNLPPSYRGQLNRIIENEVTKRFTPQGMASGETLKEIESKLGVLSKGMGRSENYDIRTLGGAVKEIQNSLRRMVERVNPEYQGELSKINDGYANFKITQGAAGSVGAQEGVFSPAQLHRAVRAQDVSKDKARFAEGNARMQDLSGAGKAVLPSAVPDSGTPLRAALMYALAHPLKAGALSIPIGAATLPYTPMGQGLLQRLGSAQPSPSAVDPAIQQSALQSILSQLQQNRQ